MSLEERLEQNIMAVDKLSHVIAKLVSAIESYGLPLPADVEGTAVAKEPVVETKIAKPKATKPEVVKEVVETVEEKKLLESSLTDDEPAAVNYEELRTEVRTLINKKAEKNRDEVVALLATFKAKNLKEVTDDKLEKFKAELSEVGSDLA